MIFFFNKLHIHSRTTKENKKRYLPYKLPQWQRGAYLQKKQKGCKQLRANLVATLATELLLLRTQPKLQEVK